VYSKQISLISKNNNWLILSYERLTCQPEIVLSEIAKHCELNNFDLMMNNVNIPSAVSVQSEKDSVSLMKSESDERQKLISKWRFKVTEEMQQKCFDVCENMNFEAYTIHEDFPAADYIL
jgi:hypothetical protein